MTTIAILDNTNRLVGLRTLKKKEEPAQDDVVVEDGCDLPTDGSYKYDQEHQAFFPLGHGFGRPKSAPISNERVLYHLVKSLGSSLPKELNDWAKWYETELLIREEERLIGRRKK